MRTGLRDITLKFPGFFLMEVIVLIIVFMSFSTVIVGWYSSFCLMKVSIIKRGQALFIASNLIESIRIKGVMPNQVELDSYTGFKVNVFTQSNRGYNPDVLDNFIEITICVKFNDKLDPVCLCTGIIAPVLSMPSSLKLVDDNDGIYDILGFVDE